MKFLYLILILLNGGILMAEHPENEISMDKRVELGRGKRDTAYPTWWGFNEKEATAYIQAAIDSPAKRVVIPNIGKPWIIRPIFLRSDLELVFEPGVEIIAKKGQFKWVDDCMFTARDAHNIKVKGNKGVVVKMHKKDYQDKKIYQHSEWRNGFSFYGCTNVVIEDLTISDTGGDGIYISSSRQPYCKDVVIRNVKCLNNHRQGISIISAENVLIENCELSNTSGSNPQAGIDLEPNNSAEIIKNIFIRNVVANNNVGPGFVFYLSPLDENSEPVSVTFENCVANNNGLPGFLLAFPPETVRGTSKVKLINCKAADNKEENIRIFDKPAKASELLIKNCSFLNSRPKKSASILFVSSPANIADLGNVTFSNVTTSDKKPFEFSSKSGAIKLIDLKGDIKGANDKKWNLKEYKMAPMFAGGPEYINYTGKYIPVKNPDIPAKLSEAKKQKMYLGSPANYVFYASKGEKVTLEFDYQQYDNYPGVDFRPKLYTPSGSQINVPLMPFKKVTPFEFTAPETGIYRLRVKLWNNRLQVFRPQGGISILQLKAAQPFLEASGRLYLNVPASSKEFALHLICDSKDYVGATLYDPKGNVFEKISTIEGRKILKAKKLGKKSEVWTLDIFPASPKGYPKAKGEFSILFVELYGIPPILATSPQGIIQPLK